MVRGDITVVQVDAVADSSIERVVFVCFDDENEQLYRQQV